MQMRSKFFFSVTTIGAHHLVRDRGDYTLAFEEVDLLQFVLVGKGDGTWSGDTKWSSIGDQGDMKFLPRQFMDLPIKY